MRLLKISTEELVLESERRRLLSNYVLDLLLYGMAWYGSSPAQRCSRTQTYDAVVGKAIIKYLSSVEEREDAREREEQLQVQSRELNHSPKRLRVCF